jgi:hypothetical protein
VQQHYANRNKQDADFLCARNRRAAIANWFNTTDRSITIITRFIVDLLRDLLLIVDHERINDPKDQDCYGGCAGPGTLAFGQ